MALDTKYYALFAPKGGKVKNAQPITLRDRERAREKPDFACIFLGKSSCVFRRPITCSSSRRIRPTITMLMFPPMVPSLNRADTWRRQAVRPAAHVLPCPCPPHPAGGGGSPALVTRPCGLPALREGQAQTRRRPGGARVGSSRRRRRPDGTPAPTPPSGGSMQVRSPQRHPTSCQSTRL